MMKKTLFLILIVMLCSTSSRAQKQKNIYECDTLKCIYETEQGRLSGTYISYYKNGKKKAEGIFDNNLRSGIWAVWDSSGKLICKRNYQNPFAFTYSYPKASKDKTIELLNVPVYQLQDNANGCTEYFNLEERMVIWSKRIWRTIEAKDNPLLFQDNKFWEIIKSNLLYGNIFAYSSYNDDFSIALDPLEIPYMEFPVVAYKIKEDCFMDNERWVSETRILGICPVAEDTVNHVTFDLFWIYYPEAREHFAPMKITDGGPPDIIKDYDDIFFWRYFSSQIYKESNVYDRKLADYLIGADIDKEAERIEIRMIETEHDFWLNYSP